GPQPSSGCGCKSTARGTWDRRGRPDRPGAGGREAGGIGLGERMTAASGATDPHVPGGGLILAEIAGPDLGDPAPDGRSGEPGDGGDQRDVTIPQGEGLAGGPTSPCPLVE